jgi:alpha-glucoside transport system permease protein
MAALANAAPKAATKPRATMSGDKRRGTLLLNILMIVICTAWTVPTFGLLVSSFRTRDDIAVTGWWTIFPHQEWKPSSTISLPSDTALDAPITIPGMNGTLTDDQLRNGTMLPNGQRAQWDSRRQRTVALQEQKWTVNWTFTTDNYNSVLTGATYSFKAADGSTQTQVGEDMMRSFLNTITVAVPATIIPILIAAFAAYAFAWLKFPLKKMLFAGIVALLVVPLQAAMIPMLRDFVDLKLNGTFLAVWLAHTTFGLPLATYLLYNYISTLPRETLESAFIDGASPFTTFTQLVLPLSVPALASFAIFQFLWVWNDYLVALIFLGGSPTVRVMTQRLVDMVGTRGQDWQLLTAGAFITMLVPLAVFFGLQRFFVRGLMAGSVKG